MIKAVVALSLLATVLPTSSVYAEPGGCLKYGAAGAVAGHVVHHGVKGFLAGCAVGAYRRHEYRKQLREQAAGVGPAPVGSAGVSSSGVGTTAANPLGGRTDPGYAR